MPLKTPEFWYRKEKNTSITGTLLPLILYPLGKLYSLAHYIKFNLTQTQKLDIPVLCVGNITVGGSGKTPTILALQKLILRENIAKSPYFLTRGYAGTITDSRIISVHCDPSETGDEPLLLAKAGKTVVSKNRYEGAKLAHENGADLIMMDDGFQNPTLHKDISFLVIDSKMGFGNKKILPAGPLREPVDEALKRAHALIVIGDAPLSLPMTEVPVFKASIKPLFSNSEHKSYIGFSGIAQPEKFKGTLLHEKIKLIDFHDFPDHHTFSKLELQKLLDQAQKTSSTLITTEKDHVRIPSPYKEQIETVPIELIWKNEDELILFLKKSLLCLKYE